MFARMIINREDDVDDGNGQVDIDAAGTTLSRKGARNQRYPLQATQYHDDVDTAFEDEDDSDRDDLGSQGSTSTSSHTVDETNIHLISGQLGKFIEDMSSPNSTSPAPTEPIISQLRNRRSSSISTRPDATTGGTISRGVGTGHQRKGSNSSAIISFAQDVAGGTGSARPSLSIDANGNIAHGSLRNTWRPPRRGSSLNSTSGVQSPSGSTQPSHQQSLHPQQQQHQTENPASLGRSSVYTEEPEPLGSPFSPGDMFPSSSSQQYPHRKHHKRPITPDYDSDGEYSENVSYAGSRPSSRRTSIQLHFQEPRSRRSSVNQKGHAPSSIIGGTTSSRRTPSQTGTPLTRQYSRNSNGPSRKGSINFVTPSLPSPGFRSGGVTGSARRTGSRSRRSSLYEDDRDESRHTWQWDQHARRTTGESSKGRRYTISDRYPEDWRGRVGENEDDDEEADGTTSRADGIDGTYPPKGRSSTKKFSTPVPGSSTFTVSRGGRGRSKSTSFSISTVNKGQSNVRRNILISFLVILGLFLLGTVLVLSSIQRYLYIQDWAYLNELELGGYNEKTAGRIEEFQQEGPAPTDEDGADIGADWKVDDTGAGWGAQGKGTGSYWMRNDWDGRVKETEWDRLSNVTNLCVQRRHLDSDLRNR